MAEMNQWRVPRAELSAGTAGLSAKTPQRWLRGCTGVGCGGRVPPLQNSVPCGHQTFDADIRFAQRTARGKGAGGQSYFTYDVLGRLTGLTHDLFDSTRTEPGKDTYDVAY